MFNRARYQFGSFRQKKRARGPNAWEFRYYETVDGVRKRCHMTLGTVAEYPTETAIRKVAEAFLLKLNSETPSTVVPRFEAVIDRFRRGRVSRPPFDPDFISIKRRESHQAEVEGLPLGQDQSGDC